MRDQEVGDVAQGLELVLVIGDAVALLLVDVVAHGRTRVPAPWITNSGAVMLSAQVIGERDSGKSASVSGSPIRSAISARHVSGTDRAIAGRFDMPTSDTPAVGARVRDEEAPPVLGHVSTHRRRL
ncbi:hypothetical protein [Saccharothrix saharensis]|uniref:hypothetical protein n=1 Tax=Saccharothrix saharensis TaxID=571190 RepID=UPI0011511AF6|nr:hypothetical protein [Saccharothrix saharensis]